MNLNNKTILVTGANRGIGRALVQAILPHQPARVYAAARDPKALPDFGDPRVLPLRLDITDPAQAAAAAAQAPDVQFLMNNAGSLHLASVLAGPVADLAADMDVNYFGTLNVIRAFVPVIEARGGGGIACVSSVLGLASIAAIGGYSASKAALTSAIQALRADLKPRAIQVFGIFPGPIDTDMAKGYEFEKTSPAVTAANIWQAISEDREDIFPDPMSAQIGQLWARDPKAVERQIASM